VLPILRFAQDDKRGELQGGWPPEVCHSERSEESEANTPGDGSWVAHPLASAPLGFARDKGASSSQFEGWGRD